MRILLYLSLLLIPGVSQGDILPLYDALRATYSSCVGIDDELADMKKMAGINTAITAVGTAAGVGAVVVGVVKADKDKQIEKLEMERLRKITEAQNSNVSSNGDIDENIEALEIYFNAHRNEENATVFDSEIEKMTGQSKKLGNWRTGLMAGATVTSVAGAVIAGNNQVDADLKTQIDNCVSAVSALQNSMMQARMEGQDVSEAQGIVDACRDYEFVDVSKINNRAKGAMISSVIGAATGLSGTVVSAVANTDKTRNDNTVAGKQKEKNLNTAANVLAAGTAVTSATATIFNATQISAIKKVAAVSEKCTGALK